MKWLYITFGILGGLVPAAYLYARTYANAENRVGAFDLGLFFLGLGLSFMVMPLGVAGGLLVAGLVHLSLNLLQRRRRPSAVLSGQGNNQQRARQPWVARGVAQGSNLRPGMEQEDVSSHASQPPTR